MHFYVAYGQKTGGVFVYMCINVYIHICVYEKAVIEVTPPVYVYMSMYMCVCVYMVLCIWFCVYVYVYMCICVYVYMYM